MDTYEYCSKTTIKDTTFKQDINDIYITDAILNSLGQAGWELIAVTNNTNNNSLMGERFIFKRKINNRINEPNQPT